MSDVDKARELGAYIVSTKDGMEVFGLIGCDELEELTDAQREFVQSDVKRCNSKVNKLHDWLKSWNQLFCVEWLLGIM